MPEHARAMGLCRQHVGRNGFEEGAVATVLIPALPAEATRTIGGAQKIFARHAQAFGKVDIKLIVGDAIGVEPAGSFLINDFGNHLAPFGIGAIYIDGAVIVVIVQRDDAELLGELADLAEFVGPRDEAGPQGVLIERIVAVKLLDLVEDLLIGECHRLPFTPAGPGGTSVPRRIA